MTALINKTNQQFFDDTALHLIKQGRPAIERDGDGEAVCLYRAPNNLTCAVGCHIPDALYSEDLEGQAVNGIGGNTFPHKSLALLIDLQGSHDNRGGIPTWDESSGDLIFNILNLVSDLRKIALNHDLSTSVLDKVLV